MRRVGRARDDLRSHSVSWLAASAGLLFSRMFDHCNIDYKEISGPAICTYSWTRAQNENRLSARGEIHFC